MHSYLDLDDVKQDAWLRSRGLTDSDIRAVNEFRVAARARACQEVTKGGLHFHYNEAPPAPPVPDPSPEVQDGISSVLAHFRGRTRSRE